MSRGIQHVSNNVLSASQDAFYASKGSGKIFQQIAEQLALEGGGLTEGGLWSIATM